MTPIITLDGAAWRTPVDFYEALLEALEPLSDHGMSLDAFIDSMIYGGMLKIEPPYRLLVSNAVAPAVREEVELLAASLARARVERRAHYGIDTDVALILA